MVEAKELIQLNNEKRKKLTKENLKYYEDMLIYIRLSYNKSEKELEETLAELLDHLVEAQIKGKTAREVFGDEPKKYADEITGELPKVLTKKRLLFMIMGILYFLAASTFFSGILNLIFSLLNNEELSKEIYIWTVATETLVLLPFVLFFVYLVVRHLRWTSFKKINKIAEFFMFWIYGVSSIGVFMVVKYLIPDFGLVVQMPIYLILLLGIILFFVARSIEKAL